MAVSSTGFSEGAVAAARNSGIEIRTLNTLTAEVVVDWLPLNAPVLLRQGTASAARVYACAPDGNYSASRPIPADKLVVICRDSGERLSLTTLWQRLINCEDVWAGIPEGGPPVERTVVVNDHFPNRFAVEVGDRVMPVERLEFDASFQAYFPSTPLVQAAEYSGPAGDTGGKERFARLGRWEGSADGPIAGFMLIGYTKRAGQEEDTAPTDG